MQQTLRQNIHFRVTSPSGQGARTIPPTPLMPAPLWTQRPPPSPPRNTLRAPSGRPLQLLPHPSAASTPLPGGSFSFPPKRLAQTSHLWGENGRLCGGGGGKHSPTSPWVSSPQKHTPLGLSTPLHVGRTPPSTFSPCSYLRILSPVHEDELANASPRYLSAPPSPQGKQKRERASERAAHSSTPPPPSLPVLSAGWGSLGGGGRRECSWCPRPPHARAKGRLPCPPRIRARLRPRPRPRPPADLFPSRSLGPPPGQSLTVAPPLAPIFACKTRPHLLRTALPPTPRGAFRFQLLGNVTFSYTHIQGLLSHSLTLPRPFSFFFGCWAGGGPGGRATAGALVGVPVTHPAPRPRRSAAIFSSLLFKVERALERRHKVAALQDVRLRAAGL